MHFERLEARELLAADVYITELLASNSGGLHDGDGDSSDWIELFNAGSAEVDLSGYYLTDDSEDPTKWAFPSGVTISPGAILLVFASDKGAAGPAGEVHTNYKLTSDGEYLGLLEPDGLTVVHEFSPQFPPQQTNISYGLSMSSAQQTLVSSASSLQYIVPTNGALGLSWTTPAFDDSSWSTATSGIGYENSPGSSTSYASLINAPAPSGTTSTYARFTFELSDLSEINTLSLEMLYDDGFVAYLNGVEIASANAPANPAWNSTAGPINRPDDTVLDEYVKFDVSAHIDSLVVGENVLAIHALNQASSSDMLMIPRLVSGGAQLIEPIVEGYFSEPTPGAPNTQSLLGVVADTNFSVDRGFFDASFSVEIATETVGATIVYTTDGSAPLVDENLTILNGSIYTGAIPISGTTNLRAAAYKLGFAPTNVDTQTYIFTSDILTQTHQSVLSEGFPTNWGSRLADYGMDPDVIGPNDLFGGYYAALIENSLKAIPTISLTLDNEDFFGPNGIYANVQGRGIDWERATSAELIFPDGSEGFQVDAGLRIHGAASRSLSKKNALRLLFKSEYGDAKLNYPLFGETGVDEFDTIVLRPHFNDGWGWDGALDDPLFIRDQWFRDTQAAMGHASARGNVVHLYVNGLYWGLYNPSERPDDSYAAETFGGDKSEYDVVSHNGLQDGSIDAYNTMVDIARDVATGSTQSSKNIAYQRLQGLLPDGSIDPAGDVWLDVVNYIDYMILNHYGGNNDWPGRNWYANRRNGPESDGFRFFAWDSEISLALSSRTSLFENNLNASDGAAAAYSLLRASDEFRLEFADRIHKHLFNGGALYVNPDSPTYDPLTPQDNAPADRFAHLASTVYDAMVAESARWGDQHVSFPRTRDVDWQNELDYMLGVYFRDRHDIVLNQWKIADLYPQTSAPELLVDGMRQHGGTLDAAALVSFQNSNSGAQGTVYYTTDGSDPRLIGGAVNTASAVAFAGGVQLPEGETRIKARILRNGEWSALTEAEFSIAATLVDNADFNADGMVDAGDYPLWRDNLGTTGGAGLVGDANHDGAVDNADYLVWRSQYGGPPPSATLLASVAVPSNAQPSTEPAQSESQESSQIGTVPDPVSKPTTNAAAAFYAGDFGSRAKRTPESASEVSTTSIETDTTGWVTNLIDLQIDRESNADSLDEVVFDHAPQEWTLEELDISVDDLDWAMAEWPRVS